MQAKPRIVNFPIGFDQIPQKSGQTDASSRSELSRYFERGIIAHEYLLSLSGQYDQVFYVADPELKPGGLQQ
jgi:hypothetical protein